MNIAICAICKDEELYLDEWIRYHQGIGVSHFFIYDNDDEGSTKQANVLKKYGDSVTYIDARGRTKLNQLGMQVGCYTNCYLVNSPYYDYMIFLDIDEFLYLNGMDIAEFVSQNKFHDTDVIHLNWRYYGDNDLVLYDARPVQERFIVPCPDDVKYALLPHENVWVKSIVKVGKPFIKFCGGHSIVLENGVCRRANGLIGTSGYMHEDIDFSCGYIKHYGTKTIDEYVRRKCLNVNQIFDNTQYSASQRLEWFFNVNRHTRQKDLIAKFFYDRGL